MNQPTPTPAPLRATPRTKAVAFFVGSSSHALVYAREMQKLERELQDATAAVTGVKELADALTGCASLLLMCRDHFAEGQGMETWAAECIQQVKIAHAALARYQRTATSEKEGEKS